MGHNVGAAAANAVKNSERKASVTQTPEQLIAFLRGNLKAVPVGYVPTHQIVALLDEYDGAQVLLRGYRHDVADATATIDALNAEKKIMTDTIFGLTQKVQELQTEVDTVALAIHARENPPEAAE